MTKLRLAEKTYPLKRYWWSHDPCKMKLVDRTFSLKGGVRSHDLIMLQSVEKGKTALMSGPQPLVLTESRLTLAEVETSHHVQG